MFKHHLYHVYRLLTSALLALAAALPLGSIPAWSLDSGWAETEGGRMRLVVDPVVRDDGTIRGILDVALDPGWKTYWRDPGSAGIPPTLDFSQSQGIDFDKMEYPAPVRVDDGYSVWAGYTAPVQFPLTFRRTLSGEARIHAQAFIGICEKICVPFQAELTVELPRNQAAGDPDSEAVHAAFAHLPEPAGVDFSIETASLDLNSKQLDVTASLPAFRPLNANAELFVAGPQGFAFGPPKLVRDTGGVAEWTVRVDPPAGFGKNSEKMDLDVVITLGQRAIEQRVTVNPGADK